MSSSDNWCSPPEVAGPLEQFFGGPVDVDPASNARSIIRARLIYESLGLALPWRLQRPVSRTSFLNEPYSACGPWTTKMLHEIKIGNVREQVRLTMASTSTQWWEDMCTADFVNPRILLLKRLAFLDPRPGGKMKRQSCRFEPALIYFGPRTLAFTRTFAHLARWATWGRS